MVLPGSHRVSRVPWYSGNPDPDQTVFAYRTLTVFGGAFQPLRLTDDLLTGRRSHKRPPAPTTPDRQRRGPITPIGFGHIPSSLATTTGISFDFVSSGYLEVSVPPVPSTRLLRPEGLQRVVTRYYPRRVSPFGNPRISACSRLPVAYRSLLRPSSALGAKASAERPL